MAVLQDYAQYLMGKKIELLDKISETLANVEHNSNRTGVLTGTAGVAMFHLYYANLKNDERHTNIGLKILMDSLELVKANIGPNTYCSGACGAGWVLDHLVEHNLVEANPDDFLVEIDTRFYLEMVNMFKENNFDFLHGGLGYAYYFLKRFKNCNSETLKNKYKEILFEVLYALKKHAIADGNQIKWSSIIHRKIGDTGYNLSLAHGMASIVHFLARLHEIEDFKDKSYSLLRGSVDYFLTNMNNINESPFLFPNWIGAKGEHEKSRVGWCYGDLGIGMTLWNSGKSLNDMELKEIALSSLKHTSRRRNPDNTKVKDAMVCHGSFGNAQIFNNIYEETKLEIFKEAANFWIEDGVKKGIHEDGYTGFKQFIYEKSIWRKESNILNGIAGIGLSLITHVSKENSWDKSLMIG